MLPQVVAENPHLIRGVPIEEPLPTFNLTQVMERVAIENPTWDTTHLMIVEAEYRTFLALCKSRSRKMRPTKEVDEVWHSHILFTERYHKDCQEYFGSYFHHTPLSRNEPMEGMEFQPNMLARQAAGLACCCGGCCTN